MTRDDKRERVAKIQGLAVLASVFIGLAMMALIAYTGLSVWFCRFHECGVRRSETDLVRSPNGPSTPTILKLQSLSSRPLTCLIAINY